MHFWPHVGKAKIGLRSGSFLWQKMNFQKFEKNIKFLQKYRNLCYPGQYSNQWPLGYQPSILPLYHEGLTKKSVHFGKSILHGQKTRLCWEKTATSQTNFGFTNLGSGVDTFRDMSLEKGKFWFGSPCKWN